MVLILSLRIKADSGKNGVMRWAGTRCLHRVCGCVSAFFICDLHRDYWWSQVCSANMQVQKELIPKAQQGSFQAKSHILLWEG